MTATAVNERAPLPGPTWPPSAPPTSFPLADRRPVVLADNPCEAGFSGADPEYAGIYLHARYFDPKLGLFLSPDPLDPTLPGVGTNRYGYAFGNPINGTDRSGTRLELVCTEESRHSRSGGRLGENVEVTVVIVCNLVDIPDSRDSPIARNPWDPRDPKNPKGPGDETCTTADCKNEPVPPVGPVVVGGTVIVNKPIVPTYDVNWANVKQAAVSEAFALALEAYANSAPCGKSKQGALRVAAIGHGVAALKTAGIAVAAGAAALALAGETGGLSLAAWDVVVSGLAGGSAVSFGASAYEAWTASNNALCSGW